MYIDRMEIFYYQTEAGRRPAEEEILSLDRASRAKVLAHIDLLATEGGALRERT